MHLTNMIEPSSTITPEIQQDTINMKPNNRSFPCSNYLDLDKAAAFRQQRFLFAVLTIVSLMVMAADGLAIGRDNPATWLLKPDRFVSTPGDTIIVTVTVHLEKGWHLYGIREYHTPDGVGPQRTEFSLSSPALTILEKQIRISPAPTVEYDSAFEINVEKLKGKVHFTLPIVIGNLRPGTYRDTIRIYHQLCTSQNCLPPNDVALPFTLEVQPPKRAMLTDSAALQPTAPINTRISPPTPAISLSSPASEKMESQASKQSWLGLLALAFALGVGSWLMPCVYPMIPITVSFFTKRAEKEHTRPVLDSIVYSLGIMSTFVLFGAVAAFFFGATAGRDIATNPWLNLFLAILFLVIAGNLFGMYELRLPASWVNALNRESSRAHGYRSSFLMGMVFSLTSFTCTVPFVDLISKMAAGGEWFRPLVAMTFYASVFALPFFLLAVFPTYIQRLPRSGIWMNHLKVSFAFIEIAFAASYLARVDSILGWQILSRELVLATWAGCTFLIALYVLGLFRTKLDAPLEYVGGIRASIATMFVALTLYLIQGMFGGSVGPLEAFVYVESARPTTAEAGLVPGMSPSSSNGIVPGQWTDDLDAAQQAARSKNLPVFIDFTGVSCTNCRWMEKNIFTKPAVRHYFERMILVRAFTDRRHHPRDEYYKRYQQERFGSTLLPFYVLLSPNGSVIATATYTPNEEEFIAFLRKAPFPSSSTAHKD